MISCLIEKLATIIAGQRPPDLTREEAIAYDVAAALTAGGVLPELTYRAAVDAFGANGAVELCYLVGVYFLVSVTLNGFDVPVPEHAEVIRFSRSCTQKTLAGRKGSFAVN